MSEMVGMFDFNKINNTNYKKKNYFSIKEGQKYLFRVLPPFGEGKKRNILAKYYSVFWLTNSEGRKIPIPSIQVKKDKVVIVNDPLLEKYQQMERALDLMKKNGEDPKTIELLQKKVMSLNPDNNYHLNVMTPTGEIGVLKLRYTAYQALDKLMKELYEKDGIDSVNIGPLNGVYFEFERYKDSKGKTVYRVDIAKKTSKDPSTGRITVDYIQAPVDEIVLKRMESEAFDLLNMYKVYTPEEMALLATLDPQTIDRVTARPLKEEKDEESPEDEAFSPFGQPDQSFDGNFLTKKESPVVTPAPVKKEQPAPTPPKPNQDYLPEDIKKMLFSGN